MKNEFDLSTSEAYSGLINAGSEIQKKMRDPVFMNTLNQNQKMWLGRDYDGAKSLTTWAQKGKELTAPQKKWAISIIQKHTPLEYQIAMGITDDPAAPVKEKDTSKIDRINSEIDEEELKVKDFIDLLGQAEDDPELQERLSVEIERYTDRIKSLKLEAIKILKPSISHIKDALMQIKPYFLSDAQNLEKFINKTDRWREYRDWALDFANLFLSNYREQISPDLFRILRTTLPEESERDQFFLKFTPTYVEFLVKSAIYAIHSGKIAPDKRTELFISSKGRGPPTKGSPDRFKFDEVDSWKKIVEYVQQKLNKAAEAGKLEGIGDYISSPKTFNDLVKDNADVSEIYEDLSKTKTEYSEESKRVALDAVKYLASICDYARKLDYDGFGAADATAGHAMARLGKIDDSDMPRALYWCRKYRRQLPIDIVEYLGIKKGKNNANLKRTENSKTLESLKAEAIKPSQPSKNAAIGGFIARYFTASTK
jgi:hypothetical protein